MFFRQTRAQFRDGKGERNRRSLRRLVTSGAVPGLLAYAGREPVGWVAVEPRERYARLAASRSLAPVDDRPAWAATCFFVARGWRKRGIARQLLAAAADHVRRRGGRILEGYPIDSGRPLTAPDLYRGSLSTFARLGFAEVARRSPIRPVMRLELAGRRARRRPRRPG